jgi:hypothetical protein
VAAISEGIVSRVVLKLSKDRLHNNTMTLELAFAGDLDYQVVKLTSNAPTEKKNLGEAIVDWKVLHPGPQKTSALAAYLGVKTLTQTHYKPIEKLKAEGSLDPKSPKGWLWDGLLPHPLPADTS